MQRLDWLKIGIAFIGLVSSIAGTTQVSSAITDGLNDFGAFYIAGREAVGGEIYAIEPYYEFTERQLSAHNEALVYVRPPFYSLVFKPLALLDYRTAHYLWLGMRLAALVGFVWLFQLPSRIDVLLAICVSSPLTEALVNGQDTVLFLPVIAAALALEERRKSRWAGVVLSLCSIKFNLFLTLPLWMLAQRRRDIATGFCAGACALVALSFVAAGLSWPLDYFGTLTQGRINPGEFVMPNVHGLVDRLSAPLGLEILLSLAVVAGSWWLFRRTNFEVGLAAATVGGLLLSYHSYHYDGVVLIPAALIFLSRMDEVPLTFASIIVLFPLTWVANPYIRQLSVIGLFVCLILAVVARRRNEESGEEPIAAA